MGLSRICSAHLGSKSALVISILIVILIFCDKDHHRLSELDAPLQSMQLVQSGQDPAIKVESHLDESTSSIAQDGIHFCWPIERNKFWLSSCFGPRKGPNGKKSFHTGIDMAAHKGTPVKAAASGTVMQVYEDPLGYGKTIVIKHDQTYKTRYAHLNVMLVKVGQHVKRGDLIGKVGDSGNVRKQGRDASHLHFELYELGKRVNPLYFLQ